MGTNTTPQPPATYRGVPIPLRLAVEWDSYCSAAWRDGVDASLAFVALGGADPDPTARRTTLWRNLADVLNALVAERQFPAFHNLSGSANGWWHQPVITSSATDAPWVVLDTATREC
ncbi:hypothetical protein JHN59_40645 [Streptomyces sp. MBT49]|uniref:hypothetical protein n=1 Tax=Streptomyces sp. MBT49 TaxID=1488380 RepID=UPI00190A1089|nr:hypothetical protein [Streptomyces sp. MBT49]MBK3630988.1 hypothetical protein [Streptomyces sp. MBT49]